MASNHELAVEILQTIPGYVSEFQFVFDSSHININMVTESIAEFERTLVTPNSRFDQWLLGDKDALTDQEKDGYRLFKLTGCAGCHNGPAEGGQAYQKMGSFNSYDTTHPSIGRQAGSNRQSVRPDAIQSTYAQEH